MCLPCLIQDGSLQHCKTKGGLSTSNAVAGNQPACGCNPGGLCDVFCLNLCLFPLVKLLFTARNSSCGKAIFSQASFCSQEVGGWRRW